MMKTRIKIHQSLGYKGYFWDVEGYYPYRKGEKKDWHTLGRGGYAMTMWGAKLAAKRKIKQRENFNSEKREWIFE